MEENIVMKRMIHIVFMFFIMLLYTFGICHNRELLPDLVICLAALDILFFALFLFLLEHNRLKKYLSADRGTDYKRMTAGFFLTAALFFGCSYFPEFVKPVLLIPILFTAFCNELMSFTVSIGFASLLAAADGLSSYEIIELCILILFGCMLSSALENKSLKKWYYLILFCTSVLIPPLFYYFHYQEFKYPVMVYGILEGAAAILIIDLFYEKLLAVKDSETENRLADLLDEEYPLVRELEKFSRQEFLHAKRVSGISRKCAQIAGANESLCAAAGFYYRIGITEGDHIAENGARIAEKNCFPESVYQILLEYQGREMRPSTIESAIVQMVDGLVKKLEVFDSATMSSNWNQDMVIYQTLNEFSEQGMYDESGLSMNKFLKIREYLLKEEALI